MQLPFLFDEEIRDEGNESTQEVSQSNRHTRHERPAGFGGLGAVLEVHDEIGQLGRESDMSGQLVESCWRDAVWPEDCADVADDGRMRILGKASCSASLGFEI